MPPVQFFFIFMQFSAILLPNNVSVPKSRVGAPFWEILDLSLVIKNTLVGILREAMYLSFSVN